MLVGGAAAAAYGSTMVTQDVDVCAEMSHANLERLAETLAPYDPVHRMVRNPRPFTAGAARSESFRNLYLQTGLGQLDVLGEIRGIGSYGAVLDASVPLELEGFSIQILSLSKLIESKEAMSRPRDLENVAILRMIQDGTYEE